MDCLQGPEGTESTVDNFPILDTYEAINLFKLHLFLNLYFLLFCLTSSLFISIFLACMYFFLVFMLFIYLGFYVAFNTVTGHITTGSWKGRGNQYIQFVRVLYCKLPTNGKQLRAFPLEAVPGTEPRPQRWEMRVLPLCHHGPLGFL